MLRSLILQLLLAQHGAAAVPPPPPPPHPIVCSVASSGFVKRCPAPVVKPGVK